MNKKWYDIYEKNKYLDSIFEEKYTDSDDIFRKNAIEFLVELGEFVNETKCFKYWTIKKPDKEKMLEEFADCITMTLYFFRKLDLDLENIKIRTDGDILDVINETYKLGTNLINNLNKNDLHSIFSNLIYISKIFKFKEEEIIESINNKHKIIEERLNSNY